jgi:hypothetical protein
MTTELSNLRRARRSTRGPAHCLGTAAHRGQGDAIVRRGACPSAASPHVLNHPSISLQHFCLSFVVLAKRGPSGFLDCLTRSTLHCGVVGGPKWPASVRPRGCGPSLPPVNVSEPTSASTASKAMQESSSDFTLEGALSTQGALSFFWPATAPHPLASAPSNATRRGHRHFPIMAGIEIPAATGGHSFAKDKANE